MLKQAFNLQNQVMSTMKKHLETLKKQSVGSFYGNSVDYAISLYKGIKKIAKMLLPFFS